MSQYIQFDKKTFSLYFCFGVFVYLITAIVQFYWMDMIRLISQNPHLSHDYQPQIMLTTKQFLAYLPFVVLGVLALKNFFQKNFSQSFFFFCGVATAYVILVYYALIGLSKFD